jgi:hypothetical protein
MNKVVPDEYDSPYMSGVDAEYHSPIIRGVSAEYE